MRGVMRTVRWPALALVALVLACSGGSSDATGPGTTPGGGNNGGTPTPNTVIIKNFAFNPDTLTVSAGTVVTFTNNDGTTHTATANDGSFDSKDLTTNASFTHKFDTAGTFNYHCAIHASMTATIVVQ